MVQRVSTVAFEGIEARAVDVQVQVAPGLPAFAIVGLPDKAVSEARERVRSALIASGLALPARRITVNLAPADLPKEGSHYDLPIALGLMAAIGAIPPDALNGFTVLGELGLDGSIAPVAGVLPAAIGANARDEGLICPAACGSEAAWASPDIQIHFIPFSTDKMGEKLHAFSGFTASVCQLRPESRGSLRIRSADPAAAPEIRINYLASETDRRANIDGIRILRKILAAPALKPYVSDEAYPGSKIVSDDDILAYCRQTGSTIYHPTSTCRMGTDDLAVVDQRLRVRGIDGLRVVDASIMPDLVSGNTNAPVIMIAEKASDMILQDAR